MASYRIVRAGGARLNIHDSSVSDDDAIRLAGDFWRDELSHAAAALEAIDHGEAAVTDSEATDD